MRIGGLFLVRKLHIGQFAPSDHQLLLFGGERVPRPHVVQVLLHDHVTAPVERFVIVHQHRLIDAAAGRILRAVDETEHVARVEMPEALYLVEHRHRAAQPVHGLRGGRPAA